MKTPDIQTALTWWFTGLPRPGSTLLAAVIAPFFADTAQGVSADGRASAAPGLTATGR